MSGTSGTGVVLASYGRGALVQAGAETLSCALRGRKQRVVCGDRVHWVSGEADGGPAIDGAAGDGAEDAAPPFAEAWASGGRPGGCFPASQAWFADYLPFPGR